MTVRLISKSVLQCKCIQCGHEWEAFKMPRRCSKCKYLTWNGTDKRFRDPNNFTEQNYNPKKGRVPESAQIEPGAAPPVELRPKPMLDTFLSARKIIDQLIFEFPCDHANDKCVCEEKKTLADIDRHIRKLELFTGKAHKRSAKNGGAAVPQGQA